MTDWKDESQDLLDDLIRQLEDAWRSGGEVALAQFVPTADHPMRQWALVALIQVDMELRWNHGKGKSVEEYVAEWPELQSQSERVAELQIAEDELRAEIAASRPAAGNSAKTQDFVPAADDVAKTQDFLRPAENLTPQDVVHYFGDYELLEELGRGGMGVVHKARQHSLNRLVAVKMILSGQLASPEHIARFRREAEAAANLKHPRIVAIHEIGEHNGQHYFSMDFIEGRSLSQIVRERLLPPRTAARYIAQVAEAIHYAHQHGTLHRDLKPSNILIDTAGEPHVTDFGLAKRIEGDSDLTSSGEVLGTPSYMPPEQAAGRQQEIGPTSDVYSLGATLYDLLTGRPPFRAATPTATLLQVLHSEPVAPRMLNMAIDRDLEIICLKCLQKEPSRRYASMHDLAADFERYLRGEPIHARPVSRFEHAWRWCLRNRLVATLLATAALLLLAVTMVASIGYIVSSRALRQVVTAQRQRTVAQVDALKRAEISQVPGLVQDLKTWHEEVDPQLNELLQESDLPTKERLRVSLALVANDDSQVPFLRDQLLIAAPEESAVIRDALVPYKRSLLAELWKAAEDPRAAKGQRLRVAGALAVMDVESPRWQALGDVLADAIVEEDPIRAVAWANVLRPARTLLRPALAAVFRNRHLGDLERSLAASILADYSIDQPEVLADLLADAAGRDYVTFFGTLKPYGARAVAALTKLLQERPADNNSEILDRFASRQANLAIALLSLGESEQAWPLLRHSSDPSARSYIIDRAARLGIDPRVIWERFEQETDVSVRRALILCLAGFGSDRLSFDERQRLLPTILKLYRDDPDAGSHGAAEWLLRQWKQTDAIRRGNQHPPSGAAATQHAWYTNSEGHTMVIIPGPVEFLMGSPHEETGRSDDEQLHRQRIGYSFAIATKPVTFEQFLRFRKDFIVDRQPRPAGDSPVFRTDWYMAAMYCNWLSKREGLPEKQWCYEPNPAGLYQEGMKGAPNFLGRTGYRLPTEAEWEYACRAGAETIRFYGRCEDLLGRYGWYLDNSRHATWPVGKLKPNDYGLFDMYGNVWTWCHDTYGNYPKGNQVHIAQELADSAPVLEKTTQVLRSGWFDSGARNLRSAERSWSPPGQHLGGIGFRVARTCK